MEKKKVKKTVNKNVTKKTTEVKKATTKRKKTKKRAKAFTLIELLAVIIILGILMIIAIPSVTSYISDSRKSAYVDTAKEIASGARNLVNTGKLGMYDTSATYYIPESCIDSENGNRSPFGDFKVAYVGVIFNGQNYKYYWISVDDTRQGIGEITPIEELDNDDIASDLNETEIMEKVFTTGIGGRKKILELQNDCRTWETKTENAQNGIEENGQPVDNSVKFIVMTSGKTKDTLSVGDELKIVDERFNVVNVNGNTVELLAKYNLYVGNIYNGYTYVNSVSESDENYLKQCSNCLGREHGSPVGVIQFSSSCFWTFESDNKTIDMSGQLAKPTFDSNGSINTPNFSVNYYVQQYKYYLESLGVSIDNARLLHYDEANTLKTQRDEDGNIFLYNTTFFTESSVDDLNRCAIWSVRGQNANNGYFNGGYYNYPDRDGVRPVIYITKDNIK